MTSAAIGMTGPPGQADRPRRRRHLPAQHRHGEAGPDVGRQARDRREHGELLGDAERARPDRVQDGVDRDQAERDPGLRQDRDVRRAVARVDPREDPREAGRSRRGRRGSAGPASTVLLFVPRTESTAPRVRRKPPDRPEQQAPRVGERRLRDAEVRNGADRHQLDERVDRGHDRDLDDEGERHVALRVLELARRRRACSRSPRRRRGRAAPPCVKLPASGAGTGKTRFQSTAKMPTRDEERRAERSCRRPGRPPCARPDLTPRTLIQVRHGERQRRSSPPGPRPWFAPSQR